MKAYLLAMGLNGLAAAALYYNPWLPQYPIAYLAGAAGGAIVVAHEAMKAFEKVYSD